MIETTIPDIDVSELMERIRLEAAKVQHMQVTNAPVAGTSPLALPQPPPVFRFPPAKTLKSRKEKLDSLLARAREKTEVKGIPKLLRRLFRKQGGFNRLLLEATSVLVQTNDILVEQVRGLQAAQASWEQQSQWSQQTFQSRLERWSEQLRWNQQLNAFREKSDASHAELAELAQALRKDAEHAGQHVRNLQSSFDQIKGRIDHAARLAEEAIEIGTIVRSQGEKVGEHLRNLQTAVDGRDADRDARLHGLAAQFQIIREELNRTQEHLRNLQNEFDQSANIRPHQEALARLDQRVTSDSSFLKGELGQHRNLLSRLLTEGHIPAKKSDPGANQPEPDALSTGLLDSFYVSFEERFRGSRDDITERQRFYLPFVTEAKAGSLERPILDLGCGRGEWLELLREENLVAKGVDLNGLMVAECQARQLDVVQADVVDYLRSQADSSFAAISGFHIIEHLPLRTLLEVLAESFRVLLPDGVVFFESPNCKNIMVGACNFYVDPTHRNPVFPDTAAFMLDLSGFSRVTLKYLSPVRPALATASGEPGQAETLDELLYGPQDFGVIGFKPA